MTQLLSDEQLIQLLPDPLLIVNARQRITEANAAFLEWVGRERQAVIGADVATVLPALLDFLTFPPQESALYAEHELAGRYMVVRGSRMPANGTDACCMLTFHDETSRKHVETALSTNEQRYRALFENSNDVVVVLDQNLVVQLANHRAAALLGVEQGHLLQKTFHRYLPESEQASFRERIQHLLAGEEVPIYETFLQDHEQMRIPVEIDMTLVQNQQHVPTELQLIVRDIRQRQLTQSTLETRLERFSLLHAVDSEVNHTLESDGVMAIALRAAVEISGADAGCIALAEDDDSINIRYVMGSYPKHAIGKPIGNDNEIGQAIIQEKRAHYYAEGIQHPDLPEVQAAMSFPLLAYDRFIGMMFLGANDPAQFSEDNFEFTQLIATRLAVALENARLHENIRNQVSELERLNKELRDTERLKTDMLRIANHDLKNPLGIVRGYVSIFEVDQMNFPPEYIEFIDSMRNSLDRMETIMDDFLTVEAFKVRAAMAEMATVDLVPLVERAVDEYRKKADDKGQTLRLMLHDHTSLFVVGDEPQLYEAATNLIGNALKYTPEGGQIEVALQEVLGAVVFKVIDNGYGIPEDRQGNLFSPFYRSRTQETVTIEGTGLGLHLVKNIIERHNGEIVFHSVYHEGSTFGFSLKRVDAMA